MSHQLFDELIGTPPPPRIDVHGIVRRERRARSARRLGGSLAAVLALALAGAAGLTVRDQQAAGTGSTPQAVAPSPSADTRFRLVFDTSETADATAKRLSQELDRALRTAAPGARWIWAPDYVGEPRKPDGHPPIFTHNGTSDLLHGFSGVSYQGRKGSLVLSISPDVPDAGASPGAVGFALPDAVGFHWACQLPPDIQEDNRYRRVCEEGTSPGGARMKIETYTGKRQPSVQHLIVVQLPDNRTLEVSVQNMVGVDESAVPAQPESPLSREQATQIAVEIADRVKA